MGFRVFPTDPTIPYGPVEWAKALWIEDLPDGHPQKHYHPTTIDVCVQKVGSGKSANTTGRGLYLLRKYRSNGIVGGVNYPVLERSVIQDHWAQRFAENGNGNPWGHEEVLRPPNPNHKILHHRNGGLVYYLNLSNPAMLKSIAADWIIIEEAPTIKGSVFYNELLGRLRSKFSPIHQVILLANPQLRGNWMYDTFSLKQFMEGYKGEPIPMGKPCECQYCPSCLQEDKIQVEWVDNECPKCGISNNRPAKRYYCVNCKALYHKNPKLVKYDGEYCPECGWRRCPGNQQFHRFITSGVHGNQFIDDRFQNDMKASMSATQYKMLGEGKIIETNTGTIHTAWSDINNILVQDLGMDYKREIYWMQDFNNDPNTTVLLQLYWDGPIKNWLVVDEILTLRWVVSDSVKIFLERYGDYRGKVRIYGDPSGFSNKIKDRKSDKFEQICEGLDNGGIDFELIATSTPIPISARLDTVNWQLCDATGYTRLRFNPRCKFSIESTRGITWDEKKNEETKKHDFYIRDLSLAGELQPGLMDPEVHPVVPLSHPQAAIGYGLQLEDPQILYADPVVWHMEPDGKIFETRDGVMSQRRMDNPGENLLTTDITGEELRALLKESKEPSIGETLRDQGMWLR